MSLHWNVNCCPAQELMMNYSLSRPAWGHYSGPSWLPGAPWTSRDMRPQWLSPSTTLNPAECFFSGADVQLGVAATEQEKVGLAVCNSFLLSALSHRFWSLYYKIWMTCRLFFDGFCFQWKEKLLSFSFSFYFRVIFLYSYPLLLCNSFLVNSH